jgi:GT2 family glycosyltransferase
VSVRTSVVVPAYEAWETLPATMEALRPQVDGPDRELVLVESSGSHTAEELELRWPWARVLAPPERTLPGRARNLGVAAALGELVAFTDADAVPAPDWLDQLERALASDVDGVAGAIQNGAPGSRVATADYLLEFSDWLPVRRLPLLHGATCNLLLRREALEPGFPEELWPGEDTVLTFPLGRAGRLAFAPRAEVCHAGRSSLREFLRHHRSLGAAFAAVCSTVDFPYRGLARRRFAVLLPAFRLVAVARRAAGNPEAVRDGVRVAPLLVAGAIAWTVGLVSERE